MRCKTRFVITTVIIVIHTIGTDHVFYLFTLCFHLCMTEFADSGSDSSSDMSEYGWEDSEDESKNKSSTKPGKIKRPPSLDKYMDIMDRELAQTDVGKSFEKQKKPTPKKQEKVC